MVEVYFSVFLIFDQIYLFIYFRGESDGREADERPEGSGRRKMYSPVIVLKPFANNEDNKHASLLKL